MEFDTARASSFFRFALPAVVHPPAASARFRVKHTREVHVHARNLDAWDQEYEQTSAGVFHGQVRELCDAGLQAFDEVASCATAQHCRAWDGGVWIGLSVSEEEQGLRFMGRRVGGLDLMLAHGSHPFELHVPAGCALFGLVIDQHALLAHLQTLDHLRPEDVAHTPWAAQGPQIQPLTVWQRWRLVGLMREMLRSLQAEPGVLAHEASRRSLREALLTVLGDVLLPQACRPAAQGRQLRRQDLVQRVRQWALEQPHEALGIAQVCAQLHVTRRTLHNCFEQTLGISPAAYLRTLRLNAVRRALQESDGSQTIADVAARWGFWHMGHFSHDYKALFGESPSQTRQARHAAAFNFN